MHRTHQRTQRSVDWPWSWPWPWSWSSCTCWWLVAVLPCVPSLALRRRLPTASAPGTPPTPRPRTAPAPALAASHRRCPVPASQSSDGTRRARAETARIMFITDARCMWLGGGECKEQRGNRVTGAYELDVGLLDDADLLRVDGECHGEATRRLLRAGGYKLQAVVEGVTPLSPRRRGGAQLLGLRRPLCCSRTLRVRRQRDDMT